MTPRLKPLVWRTSRFGWPALGLAIYALLFFLFLFRPGLLRMDDFGYLQSVTESLAAGRIRTHDWLEPYSAVTTALACFAFQVTGNFLLATWGVQALFALANPILCFLLLRRRFDPPAAAVGSLVLCAFPACFYKASEFSGNAYCLAFMLAAFLAWSAGRTWLFFAAAFLAFANRQNNVALLALPVFQILFGSAPPRQRLKLAVGTAVFLAAALLLHLHLNRTVQQEHGIYSGVSLGLAGMIFQTVLAGGFAMLGCLAVFDLLGGADPRERLRANLARPWVPAAASLLFIALWMVGRLPLIQFLTPVVGSLDRTFGVQRALLFVIPPLMWLVDWRLPRWDGPTCLCAGYLVMSSLKGYWFDFYLVDPAVAALFLYLSRRESLRPGRVAMAVAIALLTAAVAWAFLYRVHTDKQVIADRVYERLERQGRVDVHDMTDATYGFLGWKLFDHYWRHEPFTALGNFQCYVSRDRVKIDTWVPWRRSYKRDWPAGSEILEEGWTRIGFLPARYRAVRVDDPADVAICVYGNIVLDKAAYRVKPVPQDAGEWNELARSAIRGRISSQRQVSPEGPGWP